MSTIHVADERLTNDMVKELRSVSNDNLAAVLDELSVPSDTGDRINTLVTAVIERGAKRFTRNLDKKLYKQLLESAKLKNLTEVHQEMEKGLVQFFSDRCDVNLLRQFCIVLGLEDISRSEFHEASEREVQLADEVLLGGMEDLLLSLTPGMLRILCKDLGITEPTSTEGLTDAIMCKVFDLEPLSLKVIESKKRKREHDEEKEERRGNKKRGKSRYKAPPLSNIKKGITKQDLHDLYNFTDLQDFCRENGLEYSGKKALLIRRIIAFVETGEKGAVKPIKTKKRKHH